MNYVNHNKLKMLKLHLKSCNKCFISLFILHIYINISKNLSAKYYQKGKERLQKKACERYQNLSKQAQEKKATIWSWTLQKSRRRWITKACQV